MLKINFICAVYPPEPEPSGIMARQLARRLSSDGHDVRLIVPFPNRPHGKIHDGFRRRLREVSVTADGYQVTRCANWFVGVRRRKLDRLLENISFGISSVWAAWRAGRPDIMIVETWPLFATQCAALLARLWRIPFLYYVQDVYPEVAEKLGIIKDGGILARACVSWDRHLCLRSVRTIVISESMRDLLVTNRCLPADRFAVIPNWVDPKEFQQQPIDNAWRREQGVPPETFVAMFGGTLGNVSGVRILVEVAQRLRHRRDVLLICVGEGTRKEQMVAQSRRLGLENIRFFPFQSRERVPEVQGAANALLLTVLPNASDASVPSKIVSYMAAGRPILCSAPSATTVAQIVAESNAGLVVEPGDATALAQVIEDLAAEPTEVKRLGRNARTYFEKHMTLDRAYAQFSVLLHEVVQQRREVGIAPAALV